MPEYIVPISGLEDNIIYASDGSVHCNYILLGINVNRYNESGVTTAQSLNSELFTALSRVDSPEFLLLGLKAADDPDKVIAASQKGIDGINAQDYPELMEQYQILKDRITSGEFASFQRIYWLSVALPFGRSMISKAVGKFAVTDPHEGITNKAVAEFNRKVYEAIPKDFLPRPTTPDHLRWVFDRARTRGYGPELCPSKMLCEPHAPLPGHFRAYAPPKARTKFNPRSFPKIVINDRADTEAFYEKFVKDMLAGVNSDGVGTLDKWLKQHGKDALFTNFKTLSDGKIISVHNPDLRNADFPDGFVSYQACMAIASAPAGPSDDIQRVTNIVDQAIASDADFAIRFSYSKDVTNRQVTSQALKDLKSEDAANSNDELDADEYADEIGEVYDLHDAVRAETNPIGMKVTILFAFGNANLDDADSAAASMIEQFGNNGFGAYQPPGGQEDLFRQMFPGVLRSPQSEDLALVTTAYELGAMMPVRRTFLGDAQGVPVAVNHENALGQIVLWDALGSTDKGNASQLITGAQGGGKSHWIKLLLGYMIDLKKYVYLIDNHRHGEYTVFASTLNPEDTFVMDVTDHEYSLDPLKLYKSGGPAEKAFMDLWMPLLGIDEKTDEANTLASIVSWEYRSHRNIYTTRDLVEHLNDDKSPDTHKLASLFKFWASQPYTAALIDPIRYGKVKNLPPVPAHPKCVVFRTHNLAVYTGDDITKAKPSQQYSAVVYTAIAAIAAHRFSEIRDTCAFFGDEMHFLDGADDVLNELIGALDRTARKDRNLLVAGSQLAKDWGPQYEMVAKRWAMRQEKRVTAVDALDWVELPVTEFMIDWMITETSPRDPMDNNRPMKGREGEGWANDGFGNIGRIKVLPQMRADRARMSDTTSSRMIRSSELESSATGD